MTSGFWEWKPEPGGRGVLWKEGRRVLELGPGAALRGLATPAGRIVGDLEGPFTGSPRLTSTAYIATLDFPGCRVRIRSGDRVTRVDCPASGITVVPAAGLVLPPVSGAPHRTAMDERSGVCVMEAGDAQSICAFDDPASFDPALALAAFLATSRS